MYLKRIELQGFKSFADKTSLELRQGITAVVGPNGSGKSNIADAIRWVLGEQSARQLRGAKMEDVIFAGSETRKAVNYAEVSLVLDNADRYLGIDYTEVTVTRRLYRSGDSEYAINRQTCRLKDVVELLMDSGLGKEAYSIIGQGRIEEVLSTKAEDRRGMFEEAAGIVKYKSRRHEAVRRLEETEGNILRVQDIVTELSVNMGPLEEQASRAKAYKELQAELESVEIGLYVHDITRLHAELTDTTDRQLQAQVAWSEAAANVAAAEAHWQDKRREDEPLSREVDATQAALVQAVEVVERAEARQNILLERIEQIERAVAENDQTYQRLQSEREETLLEVTDLTKRREALSGEIEAVEAHLREHQAAAGGAASREEQERQLEALKSELIEVRSAQATKRNDVRHHQMRMESLRQRIDRLRMDEEGCKAEYGACENRLREARANVESCTADVSSAEAQLSATRVKRQNLRVRVNDSTESLRTVQTELASARSRLDLLRDMQHEYGGYAHGARAILQATNQLTGIHGAVAELIRVPKEYELALETALGGSLQHIVVESEANGRAAIEFLKRRQAGRATLLPLDVIRERRIADHHRATAKRMEGFVGIASELAETSGHLRVVVDHLLGQVIVARRLVDANAIARALHYQVRIVTLEGDLVAPGGSMTGGSVKRQTSLLGRTREIEELTKQAEELERRLLDLRASIQLDEVQAAALDEEAAACDARRTAASRNAAEHQLEAEKAASRTRALSDRLEALQIELEDARAERTTCEESVVRLEGELADLDGSGADLEERIALAEQALREDTNAQRDAAEALTELRVQVTSLREQRAGLDAQLRQLRSRLASSEQAIGERSVSESDRERRLQEAKDELEEAREALLAAARARQSASERAESTRLQRHALSLEIESAAEALRVARSLQEEAVEAHHAIELRAGRLDVELKAALTRLSDDYHLGYELARERYATPTDVDAARRDVARLKRAIAALGDVNLGAIEELERSTERLSFLDTQMADLLAAKDKLYQVIVDIDRETEKRFLETFSAIRREFIDVFSQLFGGGRADLVLSDPEHLLTTGIDIFAQPPGKKLQSLSLLSGGERALTAIALLFAILRVRPVPFCVLDEVEAALDDANVIRFADYMRAFSHTTQFLVITHRKGTMEEADVLYGVTMQESGVSRMMSVALSDAHEATA